MTNRRYSLAIIHPTARYGACKWNRKFGALCHLLLPPWTTKKPPKQPTKTRTERPNWTNKRKTHSMPSFRGTLISTTKCPVAFTLNLPPRHCQWSVWDKKGKWKQNAVSSRKAPRLAWSQTTGNHFPSHNCCYLIPAWCLASDPQHPPPAQRAFIIFPAFQRWERKSEKVPPLHPAFMWW